MWRTRMSASAGGGGTRVKGESTTCATPELVISSELDFYDRVSLCVRAERPSYERTVSSVREQWAGGSGGSRGSRRSLLRRRRRHSVSMSGVSLALDSDSLRACAAMHAP